MTAADMVADLRRAADVERLTVTVRRTRGGTVTGPLDGFAAHGIWVAVNTDDIQAVHVPTSAIESLEYRRYEP